MDQQEKPPAQRRTQARKKPGLVEEQSDQSSTALAQDRRNLHEALPATKQQDQPPTPPEQPKTDDDGAWSGYRNTWRAYGEAWRRYWEVHGQPERSEQIEGDGDYLKAWHTHWKAQG